MKHLSTKMLKQQATFSELLKNPYVQTIFWLFIAVLVFIQDYVDASINSLGYFISESLVFKTFWLLFIPLSLGWFKVLDTFLERIRNTGLWVLAVILPFFIGLIHLLTFSALLKTLSDLLLIDSWQFFWLFSEAISERAYFTLAIYLLFGLVYLWLRKQESAKKEWPELLTVKSGQKSQIINTKDIGWISVENAVTIINTKERKHIYGGSLKSIMQKLNPDEFKRIHRSTIINISHVKELKSRLNGDYDTIMKDGTVLRLSRNYVKSVKGRLL